jgi:tyrosine-protein kinase Etk/Wzc
VITNNNDQAADQADEAVATRPMPMHSSDAKPSQAATPTRLRAQAPPVERRRPGPAVLPNSVRWWWWRRYVAVVPVSAAIVACGASYVVPPKFTAQARLLPPQANASSAQIMAVGTGGSSGLGMAAMGAKSPSEVYAQLFLSRSVQTHAIEKLQLAKHYGTSDLDEVHFELTKATVANVNRAGLIEVSVTDPDAQRSADITNALVSGMYAVGMRMTQEAARRQTTFYDQLIAETRERLRKADDELMALESRSGLSRLKGQEEVSTSAIFDMRATLAARQVELARLRRSATEQQPDVQRLRSEVGALQGQLAALETPQSRTRANVMLPPGEYAELRRAVEPARREVESLTNVLQNLQKTREASRIDDSRDFTTIVVLDPAVKPSMKSWPITGRFMVSAFAGGMLLSLAIAFGNWLRLGSTTKDRRRAPMAGTASHESRAPLAAAA